MLGCISVDSESFEETKMGLANQERSVKGWKEIKNPYAKGNGERTKLNELKGWKTTGLRF
jgi:hypothetical protein